MSVRGGTYRADVLDVIKEQRYPPKLRVIAASKLLIFHSPDAGNGSHYVTLDERIKIRFADHENTSAYHATPDYNCVNRELTAEEFTEIERMLGYPAL
jgi:hypothetical protein